tara:strand:+ start:308 stop:646 length:339 start_codon:yes stop_codon:yes gene_type:complete
MPASYRQQSGSSLGSTTACPTCPANSYEATQCGGGGTYYLSLTQGWVGSNASLLSYNYVQNDVVWIKNGASGSIICATIQGQVPDPAGPYRIDEAANSGNGPYSNCSSCIVP